MLVFLVFHEYLEDFVLCERKIFQKMIKVGASEANPDFWSLV